MPANAAQALDQAIAWHLKVPTMDTDDWQEFVSWLEASPENRREYERLAEVDDLVGQVQSGQLKALPRSAHAHRRWRGWATWASATAAAVLLAVAGNGYLRPVAVPQREQTSAGTVTRITDADGSRIDLNGETRLAIDGSNRRKVSLESGEALFTVRHSGQPYAVTAGGFEIRDLGTVFNVLVTESTLEVSVREGRVLFDPDGARLTLNPNEMVTVDRQRNLVVKRPAVSVGSWLDGNLIFDDSRLSDVVAAMHRRNGMDIRLPEALSATHFTGNIKLSGDENIDAAHLARLIGADYHREGAQWIFASGSRPR